MLRRTRAKQSPIVAEYVIPRNKHTISKTAINPNALKVLNRLNSAGFQAYLVGGSVRDLLVGKVPKDFDIATNATPSQVRSLFRNARVIGRRFKLVHIIFYREIIEVATFRGSDSLQANQLTNDKGMLIRDNVYGTLDEDAWRRDFTVNSLYYNVKDASVIDFTKGFQDVNDRIIRIIGNADTRYQEDPVRMLRAIRFSAKLHFTIAPETAEPIKRLGDLITHVSSARLFDEVTKLYQCGQGKDVQQMMLQYGLFDKLFPQTAAIRLSSNQYPVEQLINIALENTDTRIQDNKPITPAFLLAIILWFPLISLADKLQHQDSLAPLAALESAMNQIIVEQNKLVFMPKRFTQIMREIWLLQFRFDKRLGERAFNTLQHPRFRAAYDFMALRALAGHESMELAEWWTTFQEVSPEKQHEMVAHLSTATNSAKKNKKRRRPKKPLNLKPDT